MAEHPGSRSTQYRWSIFLFTLVGITARTDHGAGVNTCWGPGDCLPPDAARCGAGFGDCNGCNLAPGNGAHCWTHSQALVASQSYCNSQLLPGTYGIPSDACNITGAARDALWNAHQIVQCYQGQVQRYCSSGYVLRQSNGQAHCDQVNEFMPQTYSDCQQAAAKMNRGFSDYTGTEGTHGQTGPMCAVDARGGDQNVKWNGYGITTSGWGGNSLGWLAVCSLALSSPPPSPPPPSPSPPPPPPSPSPPPPLPPPLPPPPSSLSEFFSDGDGAVMIVVIVAAVVVVLVVLVVAAAVARFCWTGRKPAKPPPSYTTATSLSMAEPTSSVTMPTEVAVQMPTPTRPPSYTTAVEKPALPVVAASVQHDEERL